jgi:hypothetical protein
MRRLFYRIVALWLSLVAMCGAIVVTVRLNRTPDRLQTLGFDVCDGEPCFRGITLGMAWEEVRRRLPDAFEGGDA